MPPSLSRTRTLMSHNSPESSSRLARGTHRLSAGRRHAHMCSSHPTLRTYKKQKMAHTFYFSSHVTHLYYYSCGERSLGIVYCTLTKRSGARTHALSHTHSRVHVGAHFLKLVQQNHSTIYKSRSLSACFTRVPLVHSLVLSRSKQDIGGHTLL